MMHISPKFILYIFLLTNFTGRSQQADSVKVLDHLNKIINTPAPRNFLNVDVLDSVADYIHNVFESYTDSVRYQSFEVELETYKNVIASFGTENRERIIVGAHYDVCGGQPGADDNASGVVGLLELARLLPQIKLNKRIDLVAYTLEEPPFFRSQDMGSFVHAKYLNDNNIPVEGMICLEMIGYFDDSRGSQDYPLGFLKLFYGGKGDYITVVRKFKSGKFARRFKFKMKRKDLLKVKSFQGPGGLTGIDFSDHLNYWKFGYSAVMITNTGFYRNKNYHEKTDELKTLNITRMTAVIQSVFDSIRDIAEE